MTTTIEEVTAMLPIVTPYSMPDDGSTTLYTLAEERVNTDGNPFEGSTETLAYCMIIAHYLAVRDGKSGITSEHLGQWSVTYADGQHTAYMAQYLMMVKKATALKSAVRGNGIVEHSDTKCTERYGLDNMRVGRC